MIRIIIEIDNGNVVVHQQQQEPLTVLKKLSKNAVKNPNEPIHIKGERRCATCGKSFTPTGGPQKYCSEACGLKPKPESQKLRIKLKRENPEKTPEQITSEVAEYLNNYEKKLQS